MRQRKYHHLRHRDNHPRVSIGLFFIVLGLALMIATNDLLKLGSVSRYFTWQSAMIFVGVVLLFNARFTGGILLIAGGAWFIMKEFYVVTPEIIKTFFWPAVIVLIGISFILSSLFRRNT